MEIRTEFYNNEKYKKWRNFPFFMNLRKFYNIDFFKYGKNTEIQENKVL